MNNKFKEYDYLDYSERWQVKGYPKEYYNMLNEYFSRKKYDLDLRMRDISTQVNRLIANIDRIEYVNFDKEYPKYKNTLGLCLFEGKKICLNKKYLNMNKKINLFSVLAHEIDYAVMYEPQYGILGMHLDSENEGTMLDEIVAELKANRLTNNNRWIDKNKFIVNACQYYDTVFMGTALASAVGMTEKEFLSIADSGRYEFDEIMSQKFVDKNEYYNLMEVFIRNSDIIHSCWYGNLDKNIAVRLTKDDRSYNINGAYKNIKTVMYRMLDLRIQKDILSNLKISQSRMVDYVKKVKYDYEKLEANLKFGVKALGIKLKDEICYPEANLKDRLKFINLIANSMNKLKNKEKLMQYASSDNLTLYDYETRENTQNDQLINLFKELEPEINIEQDDFFKSKSVPSYIQKEFLDTEGIDSWNNSNLQNDINSIYRSNTNISFDKSVAKIKEKFIKS